MIGCETGGWDLKDPSHFVFRLAERKIDTTTCENNYKNRYYNHYLLI